MYESDKSVNGDILMAAEQTDLFGRYEHDSNELKAVCERFDKELEQSTIEWLNVLNKHGKTLTTSDKGMRTVFHAVVLEQSLIVDKLIAFLNLYMRARHPGQGILGKYNKDILSSFNFLSLSDHHHYFRKFNWPNNINDATVSDWSHVIGDLNLAFYKMRQEQHTDSDE